MGDSGFSAARPRSATVLIGTLATRRSVWSTSWEGGFIKNYPQAVAGVLTCMHVISSLRVLPDGTTGTIEAAVMIRVCRYSASPASERFGRPSIPHASPIPEFGARFL